MEKKLTRSKKDRMIAGICGGLGEYFKIDPVIVRLIFVLLAISGGVGIVGYILLWVVVPEEGETEADRLKKQEKIKEEIKEKAEEFAERVKDEGKKIKKNPERANVMGGLLLITIGAIFLMNNFFPFLGFSRLWPLILFVIGIGMLIRSAKRD